MKRTSVVLLASGALVAAITGTALAGGNDDMSPAAGSASSATATASSAPTPGIPTGSPSESPSGMPSHSATTDPSADDTAAPTTTAPGGAAVGSRLAGQIALSHVGGGTITEVEAETEHGRAVWSVKIVKNGSRYEVHVDRSSGDITRSRAKADDDRGDDGGSGRDDRSGKDDRGGHHDDDGTGDDHHGGGDDEDGGRHGRHHD
ncbi:PepSY domain-containing protein [Streptomyces phaeochromogenes]